MTVCFSEDEASTPKGYVFVKAHIVECAVGSEFINYEPDEMLEGKSYRESWIQKHHLNPEKLKLFKVHGAACHRSCGMAIASPLIRCRLRSSEIRSTLSVMPEATE